ncbi:MAG: FAD-dependent oxidoreductase [Magnetococcales bacterium]|nr:FAD-dependent oxidoreductase [Magnetococcales bacterium]MBF0115419.1 FAD-dependent oxidoreductase [Magnetococcales bacterium]
MSHPSFTQPLILGGGLAGLTAALHLADAGLRPVLLEAARWPGGRARSYPDRLCGEELDHGPHLLLGAYRHTLQLLSRLGSRHHLWSPPHPDFTFWEESAGWYHLAVPRWPAPWHLLAGLYGLPDLSLADWLPVWRLLAAVRVQSERWEEVSVTHWLQQHKQGARLCQRLWYPLCLATLNEPPASANAALFSNVLKHLLFGGAQALLPMLPSVPLSQLFATPAVRAIQQAGGQVLCRCRVRQLQFSGSVLQAVHTEQGSWWHPKAVIAALPHDALRVLLPPGLLQQQLSSLSCAPIVSVHLQYEQPLSLPAPLLGLPTRASQWLLDRNRLSQHPVRQGRLSAVLSGAYRESHWSAAQLVQAVHQDVSRVLAPLRVAPPQVGRVIRMQRATFAAWPGCNMVRPPSTTPWHNLWLAGDWTATALPATLEGAVLSGVRAAEKILALCGHER